MSDLNKANNLRVRLLRMSGGYGLLQFVAFSDFINQKLSDQTQLKEELIIYHKAIINITAKTQYILKTSLFPV